MNTTEVTQKKAGKVTQTARVTVSKDGKTFATTQKSAPGVTPAVNNVLLFEKQ